MRGFGRTGSRTKLHSVKRGLGEKGSSVRISASTCGPTLPIVVHADTE